MLPIQARDTSRQALLAPFVAADYPASLLKRMTLARASLGGVLGYRLVTLASRTQVMLVSFPGTSYKQPMRARNKVRVPLG